MAKVIEDRGKQTVVLNTVGIKRIWHSGVAHKSRDNYQIFIRSEIFKRN